MSTNVSKTDQEWREQLTPEQYEVLRRKGTEQAFSGEYVHSKADGSYHCAACGAELFNSKAKFDSGTGWPSFACPVDAGNVAEETDVSHGTRRTEVLCRGCGGHLGHVFDDGPKPTGLRYCMNGVALTFRRA